LAQYFAFHPEETIIWIVCLVWAFSEFVGGKIIPRLRQRGLVKATSTRSDRASRIVVWLSIFVSIIIAFFFGTNGITLLPDWFFYLGIALMVTGIALRQWSIRVLGRFFSTRVQIMSDHRVVTNGPYRVIRHPAYSGSLLTIVGLGLAARTWGGTLLIAALFGLAYYYRISVEEDVLKAELGQEYIDYAKKTKRLIPFLL
jgi:protein-S-isoprenylcysteine O-methyltransferase Ste14